jgi:2-isopropylmalate synthase
MTFNPRRYVAPSRVDLPDRKWPNRVLDKAPIWCSVDLRDGNQALPDPMGHERKRRLLELLVRVGFREIELGFPAASQTDFDFIRWVLDTGALPAGVTPQVITQARDALIDRTVESIAGAPRAIVHLYNSTSELQRRVVFGMSRGEVIELAVRATERIRAACERLSGTDVTLQYSPESFTGTELDFALEISEAVANAWGATPSRKLILNLPSTVEMTTPNVFADRIEWFDRNLSQRDRVVLSVHTHNDRGTGVASAELSQLAGAERVEGTLLGNGERSGNVDIVTLAMNLYSHGVDPGLRFEDLPELVRVVEQTTRLPVHPRHPYAGELVFVAFSGSHQDAIHKGLRHMTQESPRWEVPYLPIDPGDVGRAYEPVIRINSQSGKSGLAHVLERDHGYRVPRALAVELSSTVQALTDARGTEFTPEEVREVFEAEYVGGAAPFALVSAAVERRGGECAVRAEIATPAGMRSVAALSEGPIAAFSRALGTITEPFDVLEYSEHARGTGASAEAVAYVSVTGAAGAAWHGVGCDRDVVLAAFRALVAALNRREKSERERRAG